MRHRTPARAWRVRAATAAGLAALGIGALAGFHPPQARAAGSTSWLPSTPANWPLVVSESTTPAATITSGVTEYSQTLDTVAGRQHTQVLNVNLANPNVAVRAAEAGDTVVDPADETVKSMGTRAGAVAGINGGYFDINASGQPNGGSVVNGQILKSPPSGFNAELSVLADGTMKIGQENFSGTVTDAAASEPLSSVNIPADAAAGKVTEITAALASSAQKLTSAATVVSAAVTGTAGSRTLTVTGVQTGVTTLPVPAAGTEDLLGGGAGGNWLSANVHVGDTVGVGYQLSPDNNVTQLVTAATQLIKDGQAYTDPTGQPPSGVNPETAVGISQDGKHTIFVTLDGRLGESVANGVSPAEVTGYLLAHGAYNAVLLDGGGSTEMDARLPGTTGLSVLNTPSDGTERPVANGLFVYTTATQPGAAAKVVINGGKPVETVPGATIPAGVYATDDEDNPAAAAVSVTVSPSSLGAWSDGQFTATRAGSGVLIARDGAARSAANIRVVGSLSSLTISPAEPDLNNGQSQQFTLSGTASSGTASSGESVQVPAQAATWSVADESLGSASPGGLFTAAASGGGLTNVTATVAGRSASASVAVGSDAEVLDDMSDVGNWSMTTHGGATGVMSAAPGVVPPGSSASGSMQFSYDFPAGAGVKQVVFWPKSGDEITANSSGQVPTGIGLWIKGDGLGPELAESYIDVNGTTTTLYPTTITWQGWQLVVCQLPAGMNFPLTINFLDLLTISNATEYKGIVDVGDLSALYSPRPVTTPPYVAIPDNPSWLQYKESSGDFSHGGSTILAGDDAHLLAGDPGSASANVLAAIGKRLPNLPEQARPSAVQAMGDMSDDGLLPDLRFASTQLASLGEPYHDAVGNHEISQTALPENGNFTQVFGDTHYSYTDGGANVIVIDSAHGGLLTSDAYQVPAVSQYPWLVQQLSGSTSPVVIVATHEPAYDPHPAANSQFNDRWEAQMYLELVDRYQRGHPRVHVVMLYGHARGFAEQILNPAGQPAGPGQGIPQLTIADLGMPAYAPSDEGGFYNFGLLHVTASGDLQFTVEPVLSSISVNAPSVSLAVGGSQTLTATGTSVGGDNNPAVTMPIADPASHVWSSSDRHVATVDPDSGVVTARHPGTATISVTSGGVTASATLTVTS
jgi:exopolysaccharide biosynthesis protein